MDDIKIKKIGKILENCNLEELELVRYLVNIKFKKYRVGLK
jgi:hypothetical protein